MTANFDSDQLPRKPSARPGHPQRSRPIFGLLGPTTRKAPMALIDQALVSGSNFIATVFIGRTSGMDELGAYTLAFTLLVLTNTAHEALNLAPYTVLASRTPDRGRTRYAGSVLCQCLAYSLLAAFGLAIATMTIQLMGASRLVAVLWVLVAVVPFTMLRELARRFAFAHLDVNSAATTDLIAAGIQIGGLTWLAASGRLTAESGLMMVGLACGIASLCWFLRSRHQFPIDSAHVIRGLQRNFAFGKWVVVARLSTLSRRYLVPWLMMGLLGITATGGYAAAMTLVAALNPFLLGIGSLLTPRAAIAYAEGGMQELRRVVWKVTGIVTLVTAVFCMLLALFGGLILGFVYGQEFSRFASTVAGLSAALFVGILGMGAQSGLRALEKPDVDFKASFLGLMVTLIVATILARSLGTLGGALGVLAGAALEAAIRCRAFALLSRE